MKWMTGLGVSALLASAAWPSEDERGGPALARRAAAERTEIMLVARDAEGETWRARTVVAAAGTRATIDEQMVFAPDGRLLHGFVQVAPAAGAVVRHWYEPALATVIVEEDGIVSRHAAPNDAPWIHEPIALAVGGAPIMTRLGAWATYRAASGAAVVRVVGPAASRRVLSDQLLVATERGPLVVTGDGTAALDARFGALSSEVTPGRSGSPRPR